MEGFWGSKGVISSLDELFTFINAFTTGNPFGRTKLLEVSTGRDFGALKGLSPHLRTSIRVLTPLQLETFFGDKIT